MTKYTHIEFSTEERIARIRLNRPEKGNALNSAMVKELLDAATACSKDPNIRVILLTGAGRAFCVGGDLGEFAAGSEAETASLLKGMVAKLHRLIMLLSEMRPMLVVAVNGATAGAGLAFVLVADHVIAADHARFKMAYTAAGVTPDGGTTYFLPRLIGVRRTQELAFTNRTLAAGDALQLGLITEVVSGDDVESKAAAICRTFANGPSDAYAAVKRLLCGTFQHSLQEHLAREESEIVTAALSTDGVEGIRAFVEKRPPRFT